MRSLIRVLFLGVLVLCGCGDGSASRQDAEKPLTLTEWKALPPPTKYEIETLERLKLGEPKLREQRAWDRFAREVLLPARKKEMPGSTTPR